MIFIRIYFKAEAMPATFWVANMASAFLKFVGFDIFDNRLQAF